MFFYERKINKNIFINILSYENFLFIYENKIKDKFERLYTIDQNVMKNGTHSSNFLHLYPRKMEAKTFFTIFLDIYFIHDIKYKKSN